MNRLIRWKGLAAFAAFCLALWLFWWLLAGWLVKISLEKAATAAVGAQVDIAAADLSLFPMALELKGIQVTDPQKPAFNLVAADTIGMAIAPRPLLRRKLIIEKMNVAGLRMGTRRSRPGKVVKKEKKPQPAAGKNGSAATGKPAAPPGDLCLPTDLPALSLPDAASIVEREKLASLEEAKKLEADLEEARRYWEDRLKQLPDQKKLENYRRQFEAIRKNSGSVTGIIGSAGKIKQLAASIRRDIATLEKARDDFRSQAAEFQKRAADLSKAPARDLERLKKKYTLSGQGLSNLSRLIFGRSLCRWYQTAAAWYFKIEPYLNRPAAKREKPVRHKPVRGRGLDIRFAETSPLPDFWLQQAKIGLILTAGKIRGSLTDVSDAPALIGRPTVLRLLGRNLEGLDSLSVVGRLDFTRPRDPRHRLDAQIAGFRIKGLTIEALDRLPVNIESGLADLVLDIEAAKGRLEARLKGKLAQLKLAADTGKVSGLAEEIGRVLEKVHDFGFRAEIVQQGPEVSTRISSDLDRILKKAVAASLAGKAARLEKELRAAISEKVGPALAEARKKTAVLGPLEKEITRRLNMGNDLLKGLKLPF